MLDFSAEVKAFTPWVAVLGVVGTLLWRYASHRSKWQDGFEARAKKQGHIVEA